jgi:hypothetical protein
MYVVVGKLHFMFRGSWTWKIIWPAFAENLGIVPTQFSLELLNIDLSTLSKKYYLQQNEYHRLCDIRARVCSGSGGL